MKLEFFNGSPRKAGSNSTLLINQFLSGYYDTNNHNHIIHYLASTKKSAENISAFLEADTVILIFPLYTDAMPAQVKLFLEQIAETETSGKNVGFIVQSGFPEAIHSTFMEKYLKKLSEKMQWNYLGTVIKGGVEGIQVMPESMTRKLYSRFYQLGQYFEQNHKFDPSVVAALRKPYKLTSFGKITMRLVMLTGLNDFYWNKMLKANNAYSERYATPYYQ